MLAGDLEAHLLALLWRDAGHAPAIGNLVRHLLDLLNGDDGTVFRRFARMRDAAEKSAGQAQGRFLTHCSIWVSPTTRRGTRGRCVLLQNCGPTHI